MNCFHPFRPTKMSSNAVVNAHRIRLFLVYFTEIRHALCVFSLQQLLSLRNFQIKFHHQLSANRLMLIRFTHALMCTHWNYGCATTRYVVEPPPPIKWKKKSLVEQRNRTYKRIKKSTTNVHCVFCLFIFLTTYNSV